MAKTGQNCLFFGRRIVESAHSALLHYGGQLVDDLRNGRDNMAAFHLAKSVISTAKKFHGMMADQVDALRKRLGRSALHQDGKVVAILQSYVDGPGGITMTVLQKALEDDAYRATLAPEVQAMVEEVAKATKDIGSHAMKMGLQTQDPTAPGGWRAFDTRDGHIFVRLGTEYLHDIMAWGPVNSSGKPSEAWNKLIDALTDANFKDGSGSTPGAMRGAAGESKADFRVRVDKTMQEIIGRSDKPSMKTTEYRRVNAEFSRAFKWFPAAIKLDDGRSLDLLMANPAEYIDALSRRMAGRLGVVQHFDQQRGDTENDPLMQARQRFAQGVKALEVAFDRAILALHDMPVDAPVFEPGSGAHAIAQGARMFAQVFKSLMMSTAALSNIPETVMGNAQMAFGYDRWVGAINMMRSGGWSSTINALASMGAISRDFANFSWDPNHKLRSLVRIFSQGSARVFGHHFLNEAQEYMAAGTMQYAVNEWRNKHGRASDVEALRSLFGKDEKTAQKLVDGDGTKDQYEALIREASARLSGGNMTRAEKSKAANSRVFRAVFAFQAYGQMRMNNLLGLANRMHDAWHNPKARPQAIMFAGKYLAGSTLAGAGAYLLMAAAFGGDDGLEIAWNEAEDRPVGFLLDAFVNNTITGPVGLLYSAAAEKQGRGLGDHIWRSTFPGALVQEAVDFARGERAYKDRDLGERAWTYLTRRVGVGRFLTGRLVANIVGAQAQGTSEYDPAVSAYWRWMSDEGRMDGQAVAAKAADTNFRRGMRRAVEAMKSGNSPAAAFRAAFNLAGAKDPGQRVRQSLIQRRLLNSLDADDRKKLRNRIGADAYLKLEQHDRLLELWAERAGSR